MKINKIYNEKTVDKHFKKMETEESKETLKKGSKLNRACNNMLKRAEAGKMDGVISSTCK